MRGLRLKLPKELAQDESAKETLLMQCQAEFGRGEFGPICKEHQFAVENGRKWAWDIAFPFHGIAIEVDGGIWVQGAHGHPLTILRNMEKRNWGARLRWHILCFTPDQVTSGVAVHFIEQVLKQNRGVTDVEKQLAFRGHRRKRRTGGLRGSAAAGGGG